MAKASEIIAALQAAIDEHGDLEVRRGNWDDWDALKTFPAKVTLVVGKPHCDCVFSHDVMLNGGYGGGPKYIEPTFSEIMARDDVSVFELGG